MLSCKHEYCVTIYYLVKCLCRKRVAFPFQGWPAWRKQQFQEKFISTGSLTLKMYIHMSQKGWEKLVLHN